MCCTTVGGDSHVDHDLHSTQPVQLHAVALNERIKNGYIANYMNQMPWESESGCPWQVKRAGEGEGNSSQPGERRELAMLS